MTLTLATGFYLWFALSVYGWGSRNSINLFVTFCIADVLTFTTMPIFYEAIIESTYPIAEGKVSPFITNHQYYMYIGTSGGMLTLTINIGTLIFSVST